MENELNLIINLFESEINKIEKDYKERHKYDFNKHKMQQYINKKLEKEIRILTFYNILPSIKIIKNSESFKY